MDEEEEVSSDFKEFRRNLPAVRGDGFDIGVPAISEKQNTDLVRILQNPQQIANSLGLTEEQVENICSVITGTGTGVAYKYLNKYFGGEISAMIGAGLSAHLVKKLFK